MATVSPFLNKCISALEKSDNVGLFIRVVLEIRRFFVLQIVIIS